MEKAGTPALFCNLPLAEQSRIPFGTGHSTPTHRKGRPIRVALFCILFSERRWQDPENIIIL